MHALRMVHHNIITPVRNFIKDSRATGIMLIGCTILSIAFSNIHFTSAAYTGFWQRNVAFFSPSVHLPTDPLHLVNDVLMTFFFMLVAMEIKRELVGGELASVRKSLLPILAALGGMICPAIIFTCFNAQTPFYHGWGIPMATDIAFSLGVLSLLGNKVPVQLKIFLTALAIIDDLGAVVTIALFYSSQLHWIYLMLGAVALGAIIALNRFRARSLYLYILPGIVLWYCIFNSGIHATIAGVLFAFCMPLNKIEKLENVLFFPVNFVIMPLFALANTAIILPAQFGHAFTTTISFGIMAGLVFGKPIGIFLFSFLASKTGIAALPSRTSYRQLFGISILGGIGFTMSIFTATLAYSLAGLQIISKVSIMAGSVISGLAGFAYLTYVKPKTALHVVKTVKEEEKTVPEQQTFGYDVEPSPLTIEPVLN